MIIDVLTLFPEFFNDLRNWSIIGRAVENNILDINTTNIRDFSKNKHKKVDDYPFGGGPGMIMTPDPIYEAINSVSSLNSKVIYLSPQGKRLDQKILNDLSEESHLILLCGHYEGIDNRVIENYVDCEISIGDYVLTGGEIPAMVLIDGITRLLPGTLSSDKSFLDESHYNGILEHPQYTRPRVFNDFPVPDILLSGDHKKIDNWRIYQSLKATILKRPDLLKDMDLSVYSANIINEIKEELSNK